MFRVGIDVGGTNTDAVLLKEKEIVSFSKQSTTVDISTGIQNALQDVLNDATDIMHSRDQLEQVNIGTTHFINAVIQRKGLDRVAVIRLCGPTTTSLPPLCTFPKDLASIINGPVLFAEGGYNFDGNEITPLDKMQITSFVKGVIETGIMNFVVVGVFSAVKPDQEILVGDIIREIEPRASVTLSHTIGSVGLINRENMSILNESLRRLSRKIIQSFREVLINLNLSKCNLHFTQNDGTLLDLNSCRKFPVKTFSSGATNSMRGASFLCGEANLIVLDIGGTSTDAGLIINSFPKVASAHVTIGGVSTSFSMPEVKSIGLGGGSIIKREGSSKIEVTGESVALYLKEKAKIFGGDVFTTTDYAVANGFLELGDTSKVQNIDSDSIKEISRQIEKKLCDLVSEVRVSSAPISVYIVGGGECIVGDLDEIAGCSIVKKASKYKSVANAIGAALSEISYTFDSIVDVTDRENVFNSIKLHCKDQLLKMGGKQDTLRIVDINEVALPYIPGCVARILAKVVAEVDLCFANRDQTVKEEVNFSNFETIQDITYDPNDVNDYVIDMDSIPQQQPQVTDGLWTLTNYDIHCISVGCGVLGCGGGGNPSHLKLMLLHLVQSTGRRPVITSAKHLLSEGVDPKSKVIGVAEMGSPTILHEKIPSYDVIENIVTAICLIPTGYKDGVKISKADLRVELLSDYKIKPAALMSYEIGGGNGLASLLASSRFGLPVIDCDGMGRAFPELQMVYQFVKNKPPIPAVIIDDQGDALIRTEGITTPKDLENVFREECLKRGCSSGISMSPLDLDEIEDFTILKSFSRAWQIGNALLTAKQSKIENPISTLCKAVNGRVLFSGKIIDVLKRIEGGWSKGYITIECESNNSNHSNLAFIELQNEYLKLSNKDEDGIETVLATVPDLITLIDRNSFEPVMTDELRYGLQVEVVVIPSPPQMTSSESLKYVGPQAFGFSHHYEPNLSYKEMLSFV